MKAIFAILCLAIFSAAPAVSAEVSRSPFTKVNFSTPPHIGVEHDGRDYFLVTINGETTENLMAACRQQFRAQCETQFAENFSNFMQAIGKPVGATATLDLYIFAEHRVVRFENVTVTEAKQRSVIESRRSN